MKRLKTLVLAATFSLPMLTMAEISDNDYMIMTEALTGGDVKTVQQMLDKKAGINDLYFAWSALQIAAIRPAGSGKVAGG